MRRTSLLMAVVLGSSVVAAFAEDLRPLSLKEAQEIAVRNHPRISEAQLIALASRQVVREQRSAYMPHIQADVTSVGTTASNTRIAAGALNNSLILERNSEGVSATQLITDFGRSYNLTASSKLQANAQEQGAVATRAQMLLAVNSTYFATLEAQSVLEVAKQTVATRLLIYNQISELASNKLKSGLDASFAKVDWEQSKLLQANAQNDLESQFATLSNLLGERTRERFQLTDEPLRTNLPPDDPELVQTALQDRPDLAQLRFARDAADRFVRAQRGLNYPTINAMGAAGIVPIHDPLLRPNYAAAGLNMSVPIFEGMLFDAKQKEAKFLAGAASEGLRDLEDNVIRDVRIAALNLTYAIEQIELSEELLASANEAFTLAQARYNVGSTSIIELSQSELSQTQAQISAAQAKYQYQIRDSILNYQLGHLK